MQYSKDRRSNNNYASLAESYLYYGFIGTNNYELTFISNNYTTERFMVLWHGPKEIAGTSSGSVIVYDFKSKKGSMFAYSGAPSYESLICGLNGTIDNNRLCIVADSNYYLENQTWSCEDILDDLGFFSEVNYFAIIKDGDDETVYSQLYGALMKCAIDMKV